MPPATPAPVKRNKVRAVAFFDIPEFAQLSRLAYGAHMPPIRPVRLHRIISTMHGWTPCRTICYAPEPASPQAQAEEDGWRKAGASIRRHAESDIAACMRQDVLVMASAGEWDVAVVFSRKAMHVETARSVRDIARGAGSWLKMASAYPVSDSSPMRRGIDMTDWIRIPLELHLTEADEGLAAKECPSAAGRIASSSR